MEQKKLPYYLDDRTKCGDIKLEAISTCKRYTKRQIDSLRLFGDFEIHNEKSTIGIGPFVHFGSSLKEWIEKNIPTDSLHHIDFYVLMEAFVEAYESGVFYDLHKECLIYLESQSNPVSNEIKDIYQTTLM